MNDINNFHIDCKEYLVESRHIDWELLYFLEDKKIISYHQDHIEFVMKDLDGNIVWVQERYIKPINLYSKQLKSKTKAGTKVWYFFTEIDYQKPIIIIEGEIDFLSVAHISNVIWLQGIGNLRKLVEQLRERGIKQIYLLVDKDHSADTSIGKLLDMDDYFLDNIFDSRELLWEYKDVNEHIVWGWKISMEMIYEYAKSLGDYKKLIDSFLLKWWSIRINHNEFAKYMIKKFDISSSKENLFIYNYWYKKWIWQSLDKQEAKQLIIKQMEFLLSHVINNFKITDVNNTLDFVLSHSKDDWLENALMSWNAQDICLFDGILDIETMNIRSYTKEDYKFQKLSYSKKMFDDYLEPKQFLNFLDDILEWSKDKDSIKDFLQEFIGWLFVASTKFEKALLIYWTGANWKWVLFNIIKWILWTDNYSSIWLHEINKDQYLYNLIGRLANIDSDMQQNTQLDTGVIKKLISWESISAKKMYKNPIEFLPYCRILIATNELPYLKTIDNSIRRRFVFLNLKQSFIGKEDFNLLNKILEEKNNIFVWAIDWLKRLLKRWFFIVPQELDQELNEFIKENDTIELFFEDGSVIKNSDSKIYYKDIYFLYRIFCNECWYKALSQRNFNKRLKDKWFEEFRDSFGRWFIGLVQNKPF